VHGGGREPARCVSVVEVVTGAPGGTCDHLGMAWARLLVVALLAPVALLISACGSAGSPAAGSHSRPHASARAPGRARQREGVPTIPAPGPTGTPAEADAVKVIEAWSNALRHGDVRGAAAYFRVPSEMINGIGANGSIALIRIHSLAQAVAANETLPCGAKFVSADQRGQYVNALFKLTGRRGPGGNGCGSGSGQTARTNFLIQNGQIVQWIRAPDDPGDNGTPTAPQGSGGAPV
jgi:hypothetical protein